MHIEEKRKIYKFIIVSLLIVFCITGCDSSQVTSTTEDTTEAFSNITEDTTTENTYKNDNSRLYIPTMIQKIDNTYFIMDCWQHRVLYSNVLYEDIGQWNILTDSGYNGGHTIASDGELYVLDNTDANQVLCYRKTQDGSFEKVITIGNITTRPHFVIYDETNKYFYVIGSTSGIVYVFENCDGKLNLVREDVLPEIQGYYVRSISLIDGYLYTTSGNNMICKYSVNLEGFGLEDTYSVPDEMYGMNQVIKIQDYFYITVNTDKAGDVSKANIYRVKNLEDISSGNYESLYDSMGFVGQPYYITYFDDRYYISQISATKGNGIKRFDVIDNQVTNVEDVWYWEDVSDESLAIYNTRKPINSDSSDGPQQVDIFLFCGQSNMSGKGDAMLAPEVQHGYEFRAITDPNNLYNILEPFGANENNANGINDSWTDTKELRKQGSMVSSFANSYYQESGIPIVAVSCSEGATTIEQWLPETEKYADVINRAALVKQYLQDNPNFEIRYVYFVWCQGESDGDKGTGYDKYYDSLDKLTSSLVERGVVDSCMIIQTGDNGGNSELYDTIQQAQYDLCEDSEYCIMISDSAKTFVDKGLMKDVYHYTQDGYNLLGEEAGKNAAKFSSSR